MVIKMVYACKSILLKQQTLLAKLCSMHGSNSFTNKNELLFERHANSVRKVIDLT